MTDDRASYALARTVRLSFPETDRAVRAALQVEGFGILSEIDVRAKLQEKLGEDVGPYLILGACAPPLARRAIAVEPAIGVLLPCNVLLRRISEEETRVEMMDPDSMVEVTGNAELGAVAREARERLGRALAALG